MKTDSDKEHSESLHSYMKVPEMKWLHCNFKMPSQLHFLKSILAVLTFTYLVDFRIAQPARLDVGFALTSYMTVSFSGSWKRKHKSTWKWVRFSAVDLSPSSLLSTLTTTERRINVANWRNINANTRQRRVDQYMLNKLRVNKWEMSSTTVNDTDLSSNTRPIYSPIHWLQYVNLKISLKMFSMQKIQ